MHISETVLFPNMGKLIQAIDKFKAQGQIVDIPSVSVVNLMVTSMLGYFFALYIAAFNFDGNHEKELNYLAQYVMHGLCTTHTSVKGVRDQKGAIL